MNKLEFHNNTHDPTTVNNNTPYLLIKDLKIYIYLLTSTLVLSDIQAHCCSPGCTFLGIWLGRNSWRSTIRSFPHPKAYDRREPTGSADATTQVAWDGCGPSRDRSRLNVLSAAWNIAFIGYVLIFLESAAPSGTPTLSLPRTF